MVGRTRPRRNLRTGNPRPCAVRYTDAMTLSLLEKGRLRILAHVREELELAGISFTSIQCKSGGTLTPPGIMRLIIVTESGEGHADFTFGEVEECEFIVVGEIWYKIAALIERVR
jgi:hypothetical protein